jgi:hypothetical protein
MGHVQARRLRCAHDVVHAGRYHAVILYRHRQLHEKRERRSSAGAHQRRRLQLPRQPGRLQLRRRLSAPARHPAIPNPSAARSRSSYESDAYPACGTDAGRGPGARRYAGGAVPELPRQHQLRRHRGNPARQGQQQSMHAGKQQHRPERHAWPASRAEPRSSAPSCTGPVPAVRRTTPSPSTASARPPPAPAVSRPAPSATATIISARASTSRPRSRPRATPLTPSAA